MDCSGGLIGCGNAAGYSNIDAAPFVDPATGTGYLYLSTGHEASGAWHRTVSVIPLAADLLHAAGPREPLFSVTQPWEGNVVEGPSMVHHGAGYHPPLLRRQLHRRHLRYGLRARAVADRAVGQTPPPCPSSRAPADVIGPGAGSVVTGPHGR